MNSGFDKTRIIRMCGSTQNTQCPTAEITNTDVVIRDDFGGQVRLTRSEMAVLISELAKP